MSARSIFGVRLHEASSWRQVREICERFLDEERPHRVFTPNPEILLLARRDPEYAALIDSADLALPDGFGIVLVELLLTGRRIRRWPGIDVAELVVRSAADRGRSVMLVGGEGGIAERAAHTLRRLVPGLRVETAGDGLAFRDDGRAASAENEAELRTRILAADPAVILVGLGAPKQERWIERNAGSLGARILIGVGGVFDVWGGRFRRAPAALRPLGLEWLWRLIQEPRRLPRIARAVLVFPVRALTDD